MKLKLLGSVLWVAVAIALVLVYRNRSENTPGPGSGPAAVAESDSAAPTSAVRIPSPSMTLQDFELTDTQGNKVTRKDLLGRPAVYSFVFSRCITTCRPITMEMKKLHDKLADEDVQFVTITVDPEFDTVENFARFAEIYSPDFSRWVFLTGSREAIYGMIRDGFHLQVEQLFGADAKPGMEVMHTNRVVLVNAEGVPVKTFLILNDGDRAELTRILQGRDPFTSPPDPSESPVLVGPDGREQPLSAKKSGKVDDGS